MTNTAFTPDFLASFLGWALTINIGLMVFVAVMAKAAPQLLRDSQRVWFPTLTDRDIDLAVYGYMAIFKIFVIIFNLVPYIALRIVLG